MNENSKMRRTEENPEPKAEQPTPDSREIDVPTRRELIMRYSKYALAGGSLLLFVSKAHAIHSAPP
jgi:hypothetical protein